ncbi:GyrI-like domain-containing protein [Rheinheimera sp.]|uniref:AraC family transcriptional regulator n=1 Tax=Rheinheimera sp. TaxID=1869214 RepID=UPI0027B9EDA2|nr:GyrI-like domain-containing protein [Rheinheimera sp.]
MRFFIQLGKVLHYIDQQLAEAPAEAASIGDNSAAAKQSNPLSVEALSEVACWSKFHFQRQFQQHCGLTVQSYIRLRRLLRSSSQLAFRDTKLTDISALSGYQNSESFSRAFNALMQQSPGEFRQNPDWQQWQAQQQQLLQVNQLKHRMQIMEPKVEIINFPATPVIELLHQGPPARLGDSIRRFIEFRKSQQLPPNRYATFNFLYNDPHHTPAADFRFGLAVALPASFATPPDLPGGFVQHQIPQLRCARLNFCGDDQQLGALVQYLYGDWLPGSGEQLADFPIFIQRKSFFPEVAAHLAESDIFLPLFKADDKVADITAVQGQQQ